MTFPPRSVLFAIAVSATAACGDDPVAPESQPIVTHGTHIRFFDVDGFLRSFEVYVPETVSLEQPAPLLFVFHGVPRGSGMPTLTGMNAVADELGFAVVYPDANHLGDWAHGCETCTNAAVEGVDDVRYVAALLDKMQRDMLVDASRVWATGFSQGGMMAFRVACSLPDRFAAFAIVASGMWEWHRNRCEDRPPLSLFLMNGSEDDQFVWDGITRADELSLLPVMETIGFWAERSGCAAAPQVEDLPDVEDDGTSITRSVWGGCDGGAEVALYRVEGGGHTWPGAPVQFGPALGRKSIDLDASRTVAEFVMRFTR